MAKKYPKAAPVRGEPTKQPPLKPMPTPPPPGKGAPLDGGQSGGRK